MSTDYEAVGKARRERERNNALSAQAKAQRRQASAWERMADALESIAESLTFLGASTDAETADLDRGAGR